MKIPFDMTKVTTGFPTIPQGAYRVRCTKVENGISQNQNPKADLTLEVTEGEHAGHKLWATLTFTEKAAWKVKEALDAFGVPYDETGYDPADFTHREAIAVVSLEDYTDKNNKTRPVNRIDEFGPITM